jgi:hypothetical protein
LLEQSLPQALGPLVSGEELERLKRSFIPYAVIFVEVLTSNHGERRLYNVRCDS